MNKFFQLTLPGLLDQPERASLRVATPSEYALNRARLRIFAAITLFGILYLIIAGRLTYLTVFNDAPEPSPAPITAGENVTASRADILDRNGAVLATSLPLFSVCADARKILDPEDAALKLLSVLPDLDRARLNDELKGSRHCVTIKRRLTPRQYNAINAMGIAGLEFSPDEGRTYPSGNITSHLLGFTDIDNKGIAGLERSLNSRLQQQPEPISLTIDLRLQTVMRRELSAAMDEFHAIGGVGLVMDVTNGEILSMVSLPDFDPQYAGNASDDAKFNRATLGVYEMGSTFKIFNTALALESGLIKPSDRFDTTHPLEVGHKKIRDFHPSNHPLNVAEIFMESSNIGSALMAERVGGQRQRAFLTSLGLTDKAPVELPEVGQPIIPSAANWGDATTMTVAFGHGVAVSAVQLASAISSIVNGGTLVRPTLLLKAPSPQPLSPPRGGEGLDRYGVENSSTRQSGDSPSPLLEGERGWGEGNLGVNNIPKTVISPRTAALMRALMRLVVTHGTGDRAEVAGYMVGGKTGTADKLVNGHYDSDSRRSSFIGVFPVSAPRYLVFAMLDNPRGDTKTYGFATGGWTTAPVVGRVISQIGPMLGLSPLEPDVVAETEKQLLKPLGSEVLDGLQPVKEIENDALVEADRAH